MSDESMQQLRERTTAIIAMGVIVLFAILLLLAFQYLEKDDTFTRVKDLLALVTPVVGVVVGYYFSKATSDARAEKAEASVKAATELAQEATQANSTANQDVREARTVVADVSAAAQRALISPLSAVKSNDDTGVAKADLTAAVARAQQWLAR